MKQQRGITRIWMRTDQETSEFTLSDETDTPSEYFLVWGKSFSGSNWKQIETGKNQLRPDLPATVWVCENGGNLIVDWQPAKD